MRELLVYGIGRFFPPLSGGRATAALLWAVRACAAPFLRLEWGKITFPRELYEPPNLPRRRHAGRSDGLARLSQHALVTQGNGKLAVVGRDGKVEWEMPWEGVHDLHVLPNGNLMAQQGANKVVEIDRDHAQGRLDV